MIIFKLTFLLSVNVNSEGIKDKKNKGSLESKKIIDDNDQKDYELKIEEFITCLRIEYELLPKKIKYYVEVIVWKNVAKISSVDSSRYYKILKPDDSHLWIPISIHHFLHEITEEDLNNLHSHTIITNVVLTKREITSKISCLYCFEKDARSPNFVEYFETDPNTPEHARDKVGEATEILQISRKCGPSESLISCIKFTGKTHCSLVYDTMASVKRGENIKHKYFSSQSETTITTNQDPKSRKHEVKKKDPYFIVPGEVFFTDSSIAVFKLKEPNDLLNMGYVFLTAKNLMTRKQKTSMNPFIVKIHKLDCVPVEVLKQHKFKEIFISYDIPFLVQYNSPPKPISRTIYFNESHASLTQDTPRYKYLEYLRTETVKVYIQGIRCDEMQVEPALFGSKKTDINISKRLLPREAFDYLRKKEMHSRVETLAIAIYDLSSLLKDVWTFRLEAPCHHPDNIFELTEYDNIRSVDILTIPEVNLANIDLPKNTSPLLDGILASELTSLDMEFFFLCPQFIHHHLHNIKRSYKRFFFTFYDLIQAKHLIASILQHNQNQIGLNAVIIDPANMKDDYMRIELKKRKLSKQQQASDESLKDRLKGMVHDMDDVITGFLVDNHTEVHIFVEGMSDGYILQIWNKIHKMNVSTAKVFLNSETEFESRMYDDFRKIGIYPITLFLPLKEIFDDQDIYVRGLLPVPCFRALQKLRLLLQTETLGEMLRQKLFPSSNELVSFSLEFAVPMRLYK